MPIPNIHILGIQGSGKGTQSALLVKDFSLAYASSGNLFRERAAVGDEIGVRIHAEMKAGRLLPDELLFQTIEGFLASQAPQNGFLGDGVIRTVSQYRGLTPIWERHGLDRPFLINLQLSEETALERIKHRAQELNDPALLEYHKRFSGKLVQRADDNPLAIEERFRLFRTMTAPVIAEFEAVGRIASVSADRSVEEIHADIISILASVYPELSHVPHQDF